MLSHIYTHTIFPRLNTSRSGKSSKTDFNKEMQSFVGAMFTIRLYLYLFIYLFIFLQKNTKYTILMNPKAQLAANVG